NGKRCLGGMMELMMHCHYVVAVDGAQLGMPEVTLPVVPGMEGCHWSLRKAGDNMPKMLQLLMTGRPVRAKDATGWLIDYAGSLDDAIQKTWLIASGGDHGIVERKLEEGAIALPTDVSVPPAANQFMAEGRKAILACVKASCAVPVSQALEIQAKHSAGFMLTKACQKGAIGSTYKKVMKL
ncbi:MAG: enoyl-CoA hydratase/isomerase family protein, partial [Calditrichaeota bacterium]|nr:enoyl-CoA hydratase/isomerase family protein [Calditrichota bacterium]